MERARFWAAWTAGVLLSAAWAGGAARRSPDSRLTVLPNLLTLGRGLSAAALLGAAAAPRRAGWGTWLWMLWGATASDWLDGPLARRAGATALGAALDTRADAFLTLSSGLAAWRGGQTAGWSLVPPVARYLLPDLRPGASGRPRPPDRPWQKAAGVAQMAVFAAAICPWAALRGRVRRLAPAAAALQLAALARTAALTAFTRPGPP